MKKGTYFDGLHSYYALGLIEQLVDVQPAEPKLNLIDVPGADGSKDMSELPAGRIFYKDRIITWTYALPPGADWATTYRRVSNLVNGKRFRIKLHESPDYYYEGRVVVKKYNVDKVLRQITIEATCKPWALKQGLTYVTVDLSNTTSDEFLDITLENERMPTIPTIEVTRETTIRWGSATTTLMPGVKFTSLDLQLRAGTNHLQVKSATGDGRVTISYQEGAL